MNFSKEVLSAILVILISVSALTFSPTNSNANQQIVKFAPSNYYEYVNIDGIIWRYEYTNDGKFVSAEIFEVD